MPTHWQATAETWPPALTLNLKARARAESGEPAHFPARPGGLIQGQFQSTRYKARVDSDSGDRYSAQL